MCRTNLITITGLVLVGGVFATESVFAQAPQELRPPQLSLRVNPPHSSTDKAIKHDYDIVYVRAPRFIRGKDGKDRPAPVWPNAGEPTNLRAPTDLMLLHPDGSEELLVAGGKGAIADPYVSFDTEWVPSTGKSRVGSTLSVPCRLTVFWGSQFPVSILVMPELSQATAQHPREFELGFSQRLTLILNGALRPVSWRTRRGGIGHRGTSFRTQAFITATS